MSRKSGNFPKKEQKKKPRVIRKNFRASRIAKKVPETPAEERAYADLRRIQLLNQVAHELGRRVVKVRARDLIERYKREIASEEAAAES